MISLMEKEALEAPQIIEKQIKENATYLHQVAKVIRKMKINFIQTVARGSSKNAALFGKYLFETKLNTITSQADLSVRTIYKAKLNFNNSLVIAISQSGQSPDLIEYLSYAKKNKAITIAIVNDTNSPLSKIADIVIPICAGKEKAVAATKSFLATLSTLIHLVTCIKENKTLFNALSKLPTRLNESLEVESEIFFKTFINASYLFVVARGYHLPIAQEAALKFKETCMIQADAFSSAEILHGPIAMAEKNFPSLFFFQNDSSKTTTIDIYQKMTTLKTTPFAFVPSDLLKYAKTDKFLITPKSLHPICDPLLCIQAFYPLCAKLSLMRGKNPDNPKNLSKITKTT